MPNVQGQKVPSESAEEQDTGPSLCSSSPSSLGHTTFLGLSTLTHLGSAHRMWWFLRPSPLGLLAYDSTETPHGHNYQLSICPAWWPLGRPVSVLASVHRCGSTFRKKRHHGIVKATWDTSDKSPGSEVWLKWPVALMAEMPMNLSEPRVSHQ